jgi:hypothetical protein
MTTTAIAIVTIHAQIKRGGGLIRATNCAAAT